MYKCICGMCMNVYIYTYIYSLVLVLRSGEFRSECPPCGERGEEDSKDRRRGKKNHLGGGGHTI